MSKRGLSARHSVPNQTLSLVNFRLPKGNPAAGNRGRPGGYGGPGPGFHARIGGPGRYPPLRASRHCDSRRMGGAKRYPSMPAQKVMGFASLYPSYENTPSRSRGAFAPEVCYQLPALLLRGRREDRVLAAPAVSRAICANKTAHEHTGQPEHSGLPCAMALRLTSCSPRRTALLPPSSAGHFPPT